MNALALHVLASHRENQSAGSASMAYMTSCVTLRVGHTAQIVDDTGAIDSPKFSKALAIANALAEAIKSTQNRKHGISIAFASN